MLNLLSFTYTFEQDFLSIKSQEPTEKLENFRRELQGEKELNKSLNQQISALEKETDKLRAEFQNLEEALDCSEKSFNEVFVPSYHRKNLRK